MLMEDAFLLADSTSISALYEKQAVALFDKSLFRLRGCNDIGEGLVALGRGRGRYLAEPRIMLQCGDVALLVGPGIINLARRGRKNGWQFAISLIDLTAEPRHEPSQGSMA